TILHYIRNWDASTAAHVDVFATNSKYVARRIAKVYRRHATPIYPPVDVDSLKLCTRKQKFYLTVSRLVGYKRIDILVEAFNRMPDRRLIVIGDGPEFAKIKAMAGSNVTMLGYQPEETMRDYMQRARAFMFAAEE